MDANCKNQQIRRRVTLFLLVSEHSHLCIFMHNSFCSPTHPLGWMNLGISYVENGLYEEALDANQKANELKPNNEKITFNLGNLYLRMGNLQMAEQMYRKGIEINSRSQRAHINLIVYLSEHGTHDELMAAIDNAIARALSRINFDFARIERLYQRVLELDPNNVLAHGHFGVKSQINQFPI